MNFGYAQPGGTNERKQALIKALRSGRGGAGGAARLNQATPFGAIPRLGFRPDARSVFNRAENFNFGNSPQGQQDAFSSLSGAGLPPSMPGPPQQQQEAMAPTGGFGPASGEGGGGGVPQNVQQTPQAAPSSQGFSGGNDMQSTQHLLEQGGQAPPSGAVPLRVQEALNTGTLSSGVQAWLAANPWYMDQLMGGGGGGMGGGGTVL
jgi:hypothetical protein